MMEKKRSPVNKWVFRVVIGITIIICIICVFLIVIAKNVIDTTRMSNQEIFRRFVADPIPANIQIVAGDGVNGFLDYSAKLIFITDKNTFQKLSAGYKILPKEEFEVQFTFAFKNYAPILPDVICYLNKTAPDEYIYLFWDESHQRVFLYAYAT